MEGEGDSRVHFSEVSDPWSSSRHVAVLQALDAVEKVRACGETGDGVAYGVHCHVAHGAACVVRGELVAGLQLGVYRVSTAVKEIHTELANHIHLVSDYRTFARSTYGAEKDVEICREKVKVVSEQLQTLSRFLEDHYTPEES
ncbi:hypothetical protein GQ600_18352 [Phytophthora cactorum]|nr:hypothetical protein GQ600_18352 [Phytophthora cactorum]